MEHRYLRNVVTLRYELEKCTGCGLCEEVCPRAVFRLHEGKATIIDRDLCMECGACSRNCALNAISVRAGVGCAWAVLTSKLRRNQQSCCSEPCCGG